MKSLVQVIILGACMVASSIFTACSSQIEGKEKQAYFSTETYFQGVIDSLANETISLEKEGTINGQVDHQSLTITQDSIFWQREFQAFIDADINKPALIGQYIVDTAQSMDKVTGDSILAITYSARKENLTTQMMQLWLTDRGTVKGLHIETADKNVIYASGQTLDYLAGEQYGVTAYQEVVTQARENYAMRVTFQ